jgi:hypothetical protein
LESELEELELELELEEDAEEDSAASDSFCLALALQAALPLGLAALFFFAGVESLLARLPLSVCVLSAGDPPGPLELQSLAQLVLQQLP